MEDFVDKVPGTEVGQLHETMIMWDNGDMQTPSEFSIYSSQ